MSMLLLLVSDTTDKLRQMILPGNTHIDAYHLPSDWQRCQAQRFQEGEEAQPLCHAPHWPEKINGRWLLLLKYFWLTDEKCSVIHIYFLSRHAIPDLFSQLMWMDSLGTCISFLTSSAYGDLLPCFSHASGNCGLGACLFGKTNYSILFKWNFQQKGTVGRGKFLQPVSRIMRNHL